MNIFKLWKKVEKPTNTKPSLSYEEERYLQYVLDCFNKKEKRIVSFKRWERGQLLLIHGNSGPEPEGLITQLQEYDKKEEELFNQVFYGFKKCKERWTFGIL
jgi:hypothetical protein